MENSVQKQNEWVRESFQALGTQIDVLVKVQRCATKQISEWIHEEISRGERALSRFREDSELTQLNRSLGVEQRVTDRLFESLVLAYESYECTQGVFDPRVLTILQQLGYRGANVPEAISYSDPWIIFDTMRQAVTLRAPVDLGGIGKSYIVERVAKLLEPYSEDFLLSFGGDIVYRGRNESEEPWRIGVEWPFTGAHLAAVYEVQGAGAVCTSSHGKRRFCDASGSVHHHLIDPKSKRSGGCGYTSVTVFADTATEAELWSKVVYLRGVSAIPKHVRTDLSILVITDQGQLLHAGKMTEALLWCICEVESLHLLTDTEEESC
ncbi:FAD:protein FMN transferase [Sulfoacidibacillus thermotolerans]|uniref:FAD:protein FMN transferase n=1 Tax=Sulfoacidibacillus thermotolerans TaxID=1765684 RepID=A0A2U3DAV2_SULT2|nr:FAD:protein FMN transferase [Sulfoacidibacillus thermotolerans]PWI58393.1 hypothetical protein BM613_04045 [Sulfoacidibacillus thermotolerans]